MTSLAALVAWTGDPGALESLDRSARFGAIALAVPPGASPQPGTRPVLPVSAFWSKAAILDALAWFETTSADHLLWCLSSAPVLNPAGLTKTVDAAVTSGASIVYSDFHEKKADGSVHPRPLIDYQPGSLRDDFQFGPVLLVSRACLAGLAAEIERDTPELRTGGWYDLRLRLSERGPVRRLPEPLYELPETIERPTGERVFDYVDPRNRKHQLEMERVATDHLKRIGAFLPPPGDPLVEHDRPFPVRASVIIPVKNRARTIADAVASALSQKTPFDFNVVVVDNHSDDGTTEILAGIAARDRRLVHLRPARTDLVIGGCWNEAVHSEACGRYAVQLDSDDLYDGTDVLDRIVGELEQESRALVIGAYTIVNFDLEEIPPGLVDHREWTDENGHNNALRIAGLGAPRAFHVPTLRTIGFPNVSYGEDYSVVLRLCGQYRVGRIYDSLYWCRRWEDNTDSALSRETQNRYDAYKDGLRTAEIAVRQERNASPT